MHAFFCIQTLAQDSTLLAKLVDEKWNYRYQIHVGENQTIHRATTMNWALYFSSTQKLYQQKSDRSSCASYTLSDRKIISPILPFGPLSIVSCSETELVLIFDLNSIDQYQFYFTKELVSPNDTFIPKHTLTSVVYHYKNPQQQDLVHQEYLSSIGRKNAVKKKKRNRRIPSNVPIDEPEFLQVELTGGGFRGGLDPVYRNILLIRTDGSLLFEYETKRSGLQSWKKKINRDSLNSLVKYIESKNFFTFEKIYSCRSAGCFKRLASDPPPIAMRLCVSKGSRRKVVSIAIWDGKGRDKSLIDYPRELDDIVRAIQLVADISVK